MCYLCAVTNAFDVLKLVIIQNFLLLCDVAPFAEHYYLLVEGKYQFLDGMCGGLTFKCLTFAS